MPIQIEGPPITRRERDIATRWEDRAQRRRSTEVVPEVERDLQLCLDLIAVLRADLALAVIRVTSWARLAAEHQADAAEARAEETSRASLR